MTFNFLTDLTDEITIKGRYIGDRGILVDVIAKDIIESMHLITIIDNEEIMYYENGIYNHGGQKKIKELLMTRMGAYLKKYHIGEVIMQIQGRTYVPRDKINTDHDLIHMNNGIFNIKTGEFMDFSPDIYSTNKIPVDYDSKATCPTIDKFLSEVVDANDIKIIYELAGYCLYHGYPIQKAFMFLGTGANGKSTLINLYTSFIGKNNISNKSLQEFGFDKFASSVLYGKMANLYADLSDKGLKSTGVFKALTGGDYISGERKWENSFSFVNHAKLIFSCNQLPLTKDNSGAFFRRWIVVDFPHKFEGTEKVIHLIDKITTPKELSGFFNTSVKALRTIIENGGFSHSGSTESVKRDWVRLSNSLRSFIDDCIDASTDSWITKEDFYNKYSEYCEADDLPAITKSAVGRSLSSIIRVVDEKHKVGGVAKTTWKGVKFKDNDEDVVSDTSTDGQYFM